MQDAEFTVLNEWFEFLREKVPMQVDLIVYLRTDPEMAYQRICERGRSEENGITLDYLKSIHNLHEDWLCGKKYFLPAPVVTIDANQSLSELTTDYNRFEERILSRSAMANCKG
jgi:deoxyadenosine/deoxycytidine kinase